MRIFGLNAEMLCRVLLSLAVPAVVLGDTPGTTVSWEMGPKRAGGAAGVNAHPNVDLDTPLQGGW